MQSRYLLSTLLLVCSAATSADNAGWQNARTPQTTNSASDHVQNASQNTGGVPATLVKGELPAPGQASPLVQDAARLDSELSADEIRSLRSLMADNERAINAPITSVVPRISSLTVNLSPGASLPLVRTAMNNLSVVTFTDINGSPWPQSDPPYNAAPKLFDVQYNGNMVTITPLRPWASGNISVYLKGLSVPVILNVTSGETDTPSSSQEMDSRLDLRIPRQGPTSPVVSIPTDKIALHDATLQAFLDGIPPRDPSVKRLKFTGNVPDTTIWQHGDDLLVRSLESLITSMSDSLNTAYKNSGHKISFVFERDPDMGKEEIEDMVAPQKRSLANTGIQLQDVVDEKVTTLSPWLVRERCWLAIWSGPDLISNSDRTAHDELVRRLAERVWALNSSPKDSALRKTLTNKLGSVRARKILAENFPRGSATSLIEHRAGQHNSDNVIEELASELIRKQGYNL